ncbi:YdeI/OmpD-associated family protein [Fontibacillus sp. BL9]|uniref:YdeI/OmpD-associated family protein n=1 Tax=Fontibacillus sp. BL9 TaxID=3389971 RepID=UPI00397D8D57
MNRILFSNRSEFREWLTNHALSDEGVWLVFGKKDKPVTLKASEALEEALCFGWIDGQMQSMDETTYLKYFKQRGKTSNWSDKNRNLVEKLESQGLMTDLGREKIKIAKQNGRWNPPKSEPLTEEQIQQFEDMLKPHENAYANFIKMSLSARKAYTASYFFGAKTEAGKLKRFNIIIERLILNLNPMESMNKKHDNA